MAEPMYKQIVNDLRRQIESGRLVPGARLKTEIQLQEEYRSLGGSKVSRNTVRDAITLLVSAGLVEIRPGQGTFVTKKIDPFVTTLSARGESAVYSTSLNSGNIAGKENEPEPPAAITSSSITAVHSPYVQRERADRFVASRLRIKKGSVVVSRLERRYVNGVPHTMATSFIPSV